MRGILRRARSDERDSGITTIELIVAMGIFVSVVAIFLSGVVVMTNNAVRSTVTVNAGDRARLVLQRFDKQVRYADAVNLPGAGGGGRQYIEFRTPATVAKSGVTTCTQWRWDPATGVVAMRSWADGAGSLPSFVGVTTDLADAATAGYPFSVELASPLHPRQEVTVSLLFRGAEAAEVSSASSFVARNSSVESPSNIDGAPADGVSDNPVCAPAGFRP
ncbi:PulJ/GspJ family protein [Cellulomonas fengjieae]|uniref:Prepilin-type N-terminal cleavage/methylation domain-containing protein n=1 Tax=Cellulomonas fengjieae TaxID=2819978 RepID=A0ABS3SIH1_9CELL|nr:hypothetical protein [Cellulomonas fengjieae]MBO3085546.1 hypothetical protein [Cellulomonas fengjieae]MBO3102654.1 hypothetical protein [Cellulomonas fengjieae]QVI64417.1 hypothetical protein KG102_09325 [Cellulomonas fengjieae]